MNLLGAGDTAPTALSGTTAPSMTDIEDMTQEGDLKVSAVDTKLMTVTEIVETYGVARKTVQRWINAGKIKPVLTLPGRTGAHLFDPADAKEAFGKKPEAPAEEL